MPMIDIREFKKQSDVLELVKNHGNELKLLKMNDGIGSFYE